MIDRGFRSLMALPLLIALSSMSGCSKSTPPARSSTPPASTEGSPSAAPNNTSPTTETEAPNFDPKLTLVWPGTPQESRRRIAAGSADETTIYSATFTQMGPITTFSASVYLLSDRDLQESDPRELLARHMTGPEDEELTGQQIEHGPNKYPGYEVTAKSGNLFVRRVNVMAGRRLYSVAVASLKQERLNAEDVARFFGTFAVQD